MQVTTGCCCRPQSRCLLYHTVPQTLKPSDAFLPPPLPSPCCFIHRAQGSFAKSSVVDLRRQTALQIHQNSVRLNDILLCRLANRKENSGGSVLKPRVFGQISCSVSRRDPLKCLLSSRGPPEEMLLYFTHTYVCIHAFTHKHTPLELVHSREGIKQHSPLFITGRISVALMMIPGCFSTAMPLSRSRITWESQ